MELGLGDLLFYSELRHSWNPHLSRIEEEAPFEEFSDPTGKGETHKKQPLYPATGRGSVPPTLVHSNGCSPVA